MGKKVFIWSGLEGLRNKTATYASPKYFSLTE
jgi:hypothetical protein